MNKILILFLAIVAGVSAVSGQITIPSGGTNMIKDAIANYSVIGGPGTVSVVNATHAEFNKALKINVTSLPQNYWNFQVQFSPESALEKEDVCLVSMWARTTKSNEETGEGIISAIVEHKETYTKPLSHSFNFGGDWIHLVYGWKSNMDLPLDKIKFALFCGHAVQTIEIANVQFLNYKKTRTLDEMPKMKIRYAGMEPDAAWRTEAASRIEKYRKGNVVVKLVDSEKKVVSGAEVSVEMKKHKFGFGSAIDANYYNSNVTYRNHIHELFNEVVFENDLKWRFWDAKANHNYVLEAIEKLHEQDIVARGHCLVWPSWSHLPKNLELYKNNSARLRSETLDHIEEAVSLTKGLLIDWDVINEPYTNHDLQDILGDEVMADWFKKVKEIDPDVKRYINDYSILGNGGTDINHQNNYFENIQFIDENGGEVQGIGLQSHFKENVTGIPKLFSILDRFSAFNKELKITEFDIDTTDDSLKVNYTRDFMTALFSYPYVKTIMSWGFWEGRHWKPNAAMYNQDWTIRPQGEMYKSLVFDSWWTKKQNGTTNTNGEADFGSCFLGNYEIKIVSEGKTITKSVSLNYNNTNEIIVNVDDESFVVNGKAHDDTPVFTSVERKRIEDKPELNLYPNPVSDYLSVKILGFQIGHARIQVYDINGNLVLNQQGIFAQEERFDVSSLNAGLYFLRVSNSTLHFSEKFVVK